MSTPVSKIQDPDVRCLAALATDMSNDYLPSDAWVGSPFAWILQTPSRTKGAIGEKLVAGWAASKGFDVVRSPNSDADLTWRWYAGIGCVTTAALIAATIIPPRGD